MKHPVAVLLALIGPLAWGCSIAPSDQRIGIDAPSDTSTQWYPVANFLGYTCGALDCHGDPQRNFIIWSCYGLRLDPNDTTGCFAAPGRPAQPTSPAEYQATWRSLVGLEPNVMSTVVESRDSDGGIDPQLLTFIRKPTGLENHKGGTLITPGSEGYDCVVSWLAGSTNQTDCTDALENAP